MLKRVGNILNTTMDFRQSKDYAGLDEYLLQFPGEKPNFQDLITVIVGTWPVQDHLKNRNRLIPYAMALAIETYGLEKARDFMKHKL